MNIKELAKELNLSFSTVSKALRDSHEISEKTKLVVLEKARELNYQVNPFASSLRNQKTKTIAVVIPEVVNDFFGPVITGIESIAQEKGYHVLIYLTYEKLKKEILITQLLQNGRVDGVLMSISAQTIDVNHLLDLNANKIPIVFFDRVVAEIPGPKVVTSDFNSSFEATEHLINNGCRKIAFLSISKDLSISQKRIQGYMEALNKYGIEINPKMILFFDLDDPKNSTILKELLSLPVRPDGIFASVEYLAILTYEIAKSLILRIPEDLKVLCFSNLKTINLLSPPMTSITQPAFDIGLEAASILFRLIEKKGLNNINEYTVLDSKLILRESTMANLDNPNYPNT
jgi:LacI family transcriptional regulator